MRAGFQIKGESKNTLRFHDDGTFSYRLDGKWKHRVSEIPWSALQKMPYRLRSKVWYAEHKEQRCIVNNIPILPLLVGECNNTPILKSF